MINLIPDRPEVTLPNYEAVYGYYERDPNKLVANLGHFAVSQRYMPNVVFEDGAEELIGDAFSDGRQAFLLANHVYGEDVRHLPSLLWRERVFARMIGGTNIYGKAELVSGRSKGAILQRFLYDELGMIPLFRRKDLAQEEWTEDMEGLFAKATDMVIDLGASKLDRGLHVIMFPEGERDEVLEEDARDPNTVRPLRRGFAEMIRRSKTPTNVFLVGAGLSYPDLPHEKPVTKQERAANRKAKLRPTLYIPRPIFVTEENVDDLIPLAHTSLQDAVHEAARIRNSV